MLDRVWTVRDKVLSREHPDTRESLTIICYHYKSQSWYIEHRASESSPTSSHSLFSWFSWRKGNCRGQIGRYVNFSCRNKQHTDRPHSTFTSSPRRVHVVKFALSMNFMRRSNYSETNFLTNVMQDPIERVQVGGKPGRQLVPRQTPRSREI